MNVKEMYDQYKLYTNKLSFTFLMMMANVLLMILLILLMVYSFNVPILVITIFVIIGFVLLLVFYLKNRFAMNNCFLKLEKIKNKNSCLFVQKTKLDIPNTYNIIDTVSTVDGFKLYKCKNKDIDYNFLEQAVTKIDKKNNMLTIIDLTDLEDNSLVTVEFIMRDGLCIVKSLQNELTLTSLENIFIKEAA